MSRNLNFEADLIEGRGGFGAAGMRTDLDNEVADLTLGEKVRWGLGAAALGSPVAAMLIQELLSDRKEGGSSQSQKPRRKAQ